MAKDKGGIQQAQQAHKGIHSVSTKPMVASTNRETMCENVLMDVLRILYDLDTTATPEIGKAWWQRDKVHNVRKGMYQASI